DPARRRSGTARRRRPRHQDNRQAVRQAGAVHHRGQGATLMKTPAACLSLLLIACPALAELRPPAGYYAAATPKGGRASPCPAAPEPYTGALNLPSKYQGADAARDRLNPQAYARYQRL